MPVGHRRPAALAARCPAITPRHLGRGPFAIGLEPMALQWLTVDEHQPLRVQIRLGLEPSLPTTQNVWALLLAGVRGFF